MRHGVSGGLSSTPIIPREVNENRIPDVLWGFRSLSNPYKPPGWMSEVHKSHAEVSGPVQRMSSPADCSQLPLPDRAVAGPATEEMSADQNRESETVTQASPIT